MMQKISFRLVWNYSRRLTRHGTAPVALECRQHGRRIYISSGVSLRPGQWRDGAVACHPHAAKLTVWLHRWLRRVEEIELDSLLAGREMTLPQLRTAVRCHAHQKALVRDFVDSAIISDSERRESTKNNYRSLVNDIENSFGKVCLDDITYDFVVRYRNRMRANRLSENTVKARLKALKCVVNEAYKRDVITSEPFKNITIGTISAREGGLTLREVRRIEALQLKGRQERVRDLFMFSCYTGLRWSDVSTLEEAELRGGMLVKVMKKTRKKIEIPVKDLFWGKPLEILSRYPDIRKLSHCCTNWQANHILKEIAAKANVKKNITFHDARKTYGQLLSHFGLMLNDITPLMGQSDTKVTLNNYVFSESERLKKTVRKLFKD